jgi:predicted GNAT family acetyltransferase
LGLVLHRSNRAGWKGAQAGSQVDQKVHERWPELPLAAWQDTLATLHRWTQIVGKTRMVLTPHLNHWWNVTLYVTTRGLGTGAMYSGNIEVSVEFDFTTHELVLRTSSPAEARLPLVSKTVAVFYSEYMRALRLLGVDVSINTTPNEMEDATGLDADEMHGTYDPEFANRHWRILLSVDRVLAEFRSRFIGKQSPTHFFWGAFDLAQTRFSGRTAPRHPGGGPHNPIWVGREGYSHELTSAGFWPGGTGMDHPVFYAYAYPEPQGYANAKIDVPEAYYDNTWKEFLLPYDAVRRSPNPDRTLFTFLQCSYEAGAKLGKWERAALERLPLFPQLNEESQLAITIHENPETSRFEVRIGHETAFVEYRRKENTINLAHTIVPPSLEGKGIGSALAKYSLDFARANSLRVLPSCPFIAAYIESHPEYADLVD